MFECNYSENFNYIFYQLHYTTQSHCTTYMLLVSKLKYIIVYFSDVTLKMPEYEVLPVQGKNKSTILTNVIIIVIREINFLSVSCESRQFRALVKDNTKKIKCRPRDTIVDIKYKGAKKVSRTFIAKQIMLPIVVLILLSSFLKLQLMWFHRRIAGNYGDKRQSYRTLLCC